MQSLLLPHAITTATVFNLYYYRTQLLLLPYSISTTTVRYCMRSLLLPYAITTTTVFNLYYYRTQLLLLLYAITTRSTSVDPPMAFFLQPTLSSIAAGKQTLRTPVSASSRSTDVRACPPTFLLPCFGSHKTKSLTTSFLLLQQ